MIYLPSEEQKEKPQEMNIRSDTRKHLLEFVESVKEVIGLEKLNTDWEVDVHKFFNVQDSKLVSIETEFPLYQQEQACYAVNRFIEKFAKSVRIIGYEGEMHCAPKY